VFRTFDKRAFRYLQLDVRNVKDTLEVGPISLLFSTYPVEYRGSFECSDEVLNRIWEVGRWTVQLSMEDAFSDAPWRERAQWWGDVRLEALVNYYAFGDLLLTKQGLRQIAQSQTPEGLTKAVYPTDWPEGILPTYTLLWVISIWDYYKHSGDQDLVNELFPSVERAMKYFKQFVDEDNLLCDVPHWLFVDWTDVETKGESASVNALYHGALLRAARLAEATPRPNKAAGYRDIADRVRKGMRGHLWDATNNVYRDARINGKVITRISEQANCWAIAFGVEEDETADRIIEALFRRNVATVHSATPYFSFYVLCALAKTGRHRQALQYVRERWGKMVDWGATTWWETWEPRASLCHGWSSGPTYFLPAEILGIKPGKPGWEEIVIAPHPGELAWARGKVPTPHGIVSVEWTMEDSFTLSVDVPRKSVVTVPLMKHGVVSVTTQAGNVPTSADRLPDANGYAQLLFNEPGTYRIRSS